MVVAVMVLMLVLVLVMDGCCVVDCASLCLFWWGRDPCSVVAATFHP